MASNNYTSANVVPSADTFREWVDLTNRITYDMEKVVVTVAANTQGARTSGNASVNGYFSANTLLVETSMRGASANSTIYGTKAPSANLLITSNVVFDSGNSTVGAIIHAQSNAHFTGANVEFSSNVSINSTSTSFTSNAITNIFNTKIDANANLDIDNALTHITSTNTVIENGQLNITSNVNIDAATFDINDGVLKANTTGVEIDATAVTFTSNATTNIFNTKIDANANIDIDNALTTITSTNTAIDGVLNVSGSLTDIISTLTEIHGETLDVTSNVTVNAASVYVDSANVTLGQANTDKFHVISDAKFYDKLNVVKAADFDSTVNVDGATTLNGAVTLGNATGDDLTFTGYAATGITPKENGTLSLGTTLLRFDANLDDVSIDDVDVIDTATVHGAGFFDTTFSVNTAFTVGFSGEDANTRTITLGSLQDSNSKVIIKGMVGNSTIGVMPLGNTVALGNTTNRWILTGNTGHFSNTLAAGSTTVTGFMKASGEVEGGSLDINGVADISGKLDVHDGADISGPTLNVTSNVTVNAASVYVDSANVTLGQANTDEFHVISDAKLHDKLNVVKAVDLDSTLNVDGAATFNGAVTLGNATGDDLTFTGYAATGITPKENGTLSLGTAALRFDANLDDVSIDDLNVIDSATVLGTGHFGNNFAVNTAFTVGFSGANADVRTITIGAEADANNRVIIKGLVGNSTVGVLPLTNGVALGNTSNRWDVFGKTGNFSETLAAGNTTITGFMAASGEVEGGSLDINGVADISGLLTLSAGANIAGAITHTSGALTVTGATALNGGLTMDTNKFTVADTSGNVGTAGTLAVAGNTTITSDEEAVSFVAASGGDAEVPQAGALQVSGGILALKNIQTEANGNFGAVNVTGNIDVDTNANIDGNLVVKGTTTLGDAIGDTITLTGQVFGNTTAGGITPSGNGAPLGTNTKRWTAAFMTANTATTLAVGTDATVGANLTVSAAASVGTDLTVGNDINMANTGNIVFSNTGLTGVTKTTVTSNNISVDYMQVQKNLTFPDTITLIGQTLGSEELTVSNNAHFTGAGAANSQPTVTFGSGTNTVFIDTTAGRFSADIRPSGTNTKDVGTAALSWRTGYFDTSVVIGDTVANTTAVLADNIYARDDLVASYSSDENLKDNIVVLDNALNRVESISGYSFDWNSKVGDYREGTPDYGVLAQEIENILPNAVTTNGRGYKTVSYNAIIPLLVEAVKELSAKVDYYMQAEREGEE